MPLFINEELEPFSINFVEKVFDYDKEMCCNNIMSNEKKNFSWVLENSPFSVPIINYLSVYAKVCYMKQHLFICIFFYSTTGAIQHGVHCLVQNYQRFCSQEKFVWETYNIVDEIPYDCRLLYQNIKLEFARSFIRLIKIM